MWFRYYLNAYICNEMDQLETQKGVLQFDHQSASNDGSPDGSEMQTAGIPHADGNFTDRQGVSWSADTSLMCSQADISQMNDEWVRSTKDKLFRNLTPQQRWILQLLYLNEFSWVQVGAMLGCTTQTARAQYREVMDYLRGRSGVVATVPKQERLHGTGSVKPDPIQGEPAAFEPTDLVPWQEPVQSRQQLPA